MSIRNRIDISLYWVLVTLMAIITLNVLWQVASRYLLRAPSPFTDELARFLLIWISLLGASYVSGKQLHLAIDLLPSRLEGRRQRRLQAFIQLLIALFALLVMVWGGLKLVYITLVLGQISPALNIPLGWVYSVLPLSGLLITYYSLSNLFAPPPAAVQLGKEIA
jgi:TRAP-type C4-dicarboxylate transport system permease small subunit